MLLPPPELRPIVKKTKEAVIEQYLRNRIRMLGGKCYKFVSPQNRGVSDRLCVLPYGVSIFVECKRPKGKPKPQQDKFLKEMQEMGHYTDTVSTKAEVDALYQRFLILMKGLEYEQNADSTI